MNFNTMKLIQRLSYTFIYQYTLLLLLIIFGMCIGLWVETLAPTLPIFRDKLNISYDLLGKIISLKAIGTILSLLVIGILYDSFPYYVNYLMFGEALLGSLATYTLPWSSSLWIFGALIYIQSGCIAALTNGAQLNILKLFGKDAVGKMQIAHLGYGVGGLFSGLIAQRFLPSNNEVSQKFKSTKYCQNIMNMTVNELSINITNSNQTGLADQSKFEYIFIITGSVGLFGALLFLLHNIFIKSPLQFAPKSKVPLSWFNTLKPSYLVPHHDNVNPLYPYTMITLMFLYYLFYEIGVGSLVSYLAVFAVDPCKSYSMSIRKAAILHSVINGCFLCGRLVNSFIMNYNPTLILLLFNFLNVVFNIILVIFGTKYEIGLWIGICGMRFVNAPVYPAGTSYTNRFIRVTGSLISIAFIGSTISLSIGVTLGGYMLDNFPSISILYCSLLSMIMLFLVTMAMAIIGHRCGIRTDKMEHDISQIPPESRKELLDKD